MYEYTARLIDITDGDTARLLITLIDDAIDVGFGVTSYRHETKREKVRLYGINAPELRAAGTAGEDASAYADQWVVEHCPEGTFTLNTFKTSGVDADDKQEKYGRYLAIITAPDGHRLNDDLVTAGHAVPYMVK